MERRATTSYREPTAARAAGSGARPSPAAITLAWLTRLRWGAVLGQGTTVAFAAFVLGLDLPLVPLFVLVSATAASNVALEVRLGSREDVSSRTAGIVLAADTLILSGFLYFAGGPSNPFSVLYLVHVTLAALVLGLRWGLAIVVVATTSYALLFFFHRPIVGMDHEHRGSFAFSIHLQGMWIAFTVAGVLIAYFVAKVAAELRGREAELALAQRAAARTEKLASLTTLAAGAAHELGTPLGTIAIAAKELERSVAQSPEEAREDAILIRTEVERCRAILRRMSARAGATIGELPEEVTPRRAVAVALARLPAADRVRVRTNDFALETRVSVPSEALVQVLLNLIQNGLDASADTNGEVVVATEVDARVVRFVVVDRGSGIRDEDAARVGEPFFTTKEVGKGMGLGVFLAHTFADRWGGSLAFEAGIEMGTRVVLAFPRIEDEP